ncbi:MAG: SDR family NAD(P)-dependent oxidoreductase [Dehalococcoidia bacterium]
MTAEPLNGRVVAFIGTGSASDRALVVGLAESGANLALATTAQEQTQEFAMNSIANEAWVIGREHFVTVMDASDDTAVNAFAEQVWDRYGRCDALVCAHDRASVIPIDELAQHEFRATVDALVTAPFLAAQAFGRLLARDGHGEIVFLTADRSDADAGVLAAAAALAGLEAAIETAWSHHNVHTRRLSLAGTDDAAVMSEVCGRLIAALNG